MTDEQRLKEIDKQLELLRQGYIDDYGSIIKDKKYDKYSEKWKKKLGKVAEKYVKYMAPLEEEYNEIVDKIVKKEQAELKKKFVDPE